MIAIDFNFRARQGSTRTGSQSARRLPQDAQDDGRNSVREDQTRRRIPKGTQFIRFDMIEIHENKTS